MIKSVFVISAIILFILIVWWFLASTPYPVAEPITDIADKGINSNVPICLPSLPNPLNPPHLPNQFNQFSPSNQFNQFILPNSPESSNEEVLDTLYRDEQAVKQNISYASIKILEDVYDMDQQGKKVSIGERISAKALQYIYGIEFKSTRSIPWLYNTETKRPLELDCYNEELKLAVEYSGVQHYTWPNFLSKSGKQTKEQFIEQLRRDKLKAELCKLHGVYLIIVPYTVPHDQILNYIHENCPETVQKRRGIRNVISCVGSSCPSLSLSTLSSRSAHSSS